MERGRRFESPPTLTISIVPEGEIVSGAPCVFVFVFVARKENGSETGSTLLAPPRTHGQDIYDHLKKHHGGGRLFCTVHRPDMIDPRH